MSDKLSSLNEVKKVVRSSVEPAASDGLTQSERFMQAARELECDDDPERFKERVKRLVKTGAEAPTKPPFKDRP